jgi:hypothetical protein
VFSAKGDGFLKERRFTNRRRFGSAVCKPPLLVCSADVRLYNARYSTAEATFLFFPYRRINHSVVPYFACEITVARSISSCGIALRSNRSQSVRAKSSINRCGNLAF